MDKKVYPWKQEFGDRYAKFDSGHGGNEDIYYPDPMLKLDEHL